MLNGVLGKVQLVKALFFDNGGSIIISQGMIMSAVFVLLVQTTENTQQHRGWCVTLVTLDFVGREVLATLRALKRDPRNAWCSDDTVSLTHADDLGILRCFVLFDHLFNIITILYMPQANITILVEREASNMTMNIALFAHIRYRDNPFIITRDTDIVNPIAMSLCQRERHSGGQKMDILLTLSTNLCVILSKSHRMTRRS